MFVCITFFCTSLNFLFLFFTCTCMCTFYSLQSYTQLLIQVGQDTAIAEEQNELIKKQTERIQHLQQVLGTPSKYRYWQFLHVSYNAIQLRT